MTTTTTTTPKGSRQGWLVSPAVDIGFVLGGGLLLSLTLFLTWRQQVGFLVATTLFAMLSDFPHVLQTSARIWLDPTERELHSRHWSVSLAVIGAVVLSIVLTGWIVIALLAWTYWQIWHVLKQHLGMINIYAAKHRYAGQKQLTKALLLTGCLAPVLYRAAHGFEFSEYRMFDFTLPFSGMVVPTPPIPMALVAAAYVIFAVVAVVWFREQIDLRAEGKTMLPGISVATLIIAILSYNFGYLLVSDLYALILIATTVHSLQYHVISWARNNGHFYGDEERLSKEERQLLLAKLSHPRALPWYAAVFALAGVLMAAAEQVLLGALPLTIVFHHFYMDGIVWKGKKNPGLAHDLQIAPRRNAEPSQR